MKVVIISDVHLGDPACRLVQNTGGNLQLTSVYDQLKDAAGQNNDYLVLLGDVFDLSVASWEEAYSAGALFFQALRKDRIANEVILVPGNHDHALWGVVLHEANVVNPIRKGKPPKNRWTFPGVIDDRQGTTTSGLVLPNVTRNATPGEPAYGGLFLDDLSKDPVTNEKLAVNVAYPNLWLLTDTGKTILLTHGQYWERYWALSMELARSIAQSDLKLGCGARPTMEDIVAVNFPLNELASSGIGQAGALATIVRDIQREYKDGKFARIDRYIERAKGYLDEQFRFSWREFYKEIATDVVVKAIASHLTSALKGGRDEERGTRRAAARGNTQYLAAKDVSARLDEYLLASLHELDWIGTQLKASLPRPGCLVFGHTHEPIVTGDACAHQSPTGDVLTVYNTGGWLGQGKGAVFAYDSGKGLTTRAVI